MSTVADSPRGMWTYTDVSFRSIAVDIVQPNLTLSVAVVADIYLSSDISVALYVITNTNFVI